MKVSLISTVKDASAHIEEWVGSVAAQTRQPDEVIVVDGGSTDGTPELLRRAAGDSFTVIEERDANIARGRNLALAAAAHDVIAVTDADCVLDAQWLERILEPIEAGADVSMGFYVAITDGFLQACLASVNLPLDASEVDPGRFMPSARSVAFRRGSIDAAGGYPEWLVDRRGHVGQPPLAGAGPGHAVRARGGGPVAPPPVAPRGVGAVLPVRARRRAGGDVPRTARAPVRRIRRRGRGARIA